MDLDYLVLFACSIWILCWVVLLEKLGVFIVDHSIGALGDSFYEYLLKHWLITGKKDKLTKDEYDVAVFAMEKKMLFESQQNKLW